MFTKNNDAIAGEEETRPPNKNNPRLRGLTCLTGDTKIKLLNGSSVNIDTLTYGQEIYVYACKENGEVVPAKAIALGETKKVTEILEITLDNNETIKCTPEHLWMLRDGSYKEAHLLQPNDLLMSLKSINGINHKILSIKKITYESPIRVYDINVPEYENFATDAGVFLHNCKHILGTTIFFKDFIEKIIQMALDNANELSKNNGTNKPLGNNRRNKFFKKKAKKKIDDESWTTLSIDLDNFDLVQWEKDLALLGSEK